MSFRDRVLAVGGRGQLRGKLLNLMPVMSGSGPEYDVGQLVTYVNDACMVAPSMLLTSGVTWKGVDDNSFDLTLVDRGNTVTAASSSTMTDIWSISAPLIPTSPRRKVFSRPLDHAGRRLDLVALGRPMPRSARTIWHLRLATSAMGRIWPSRRSSSTWRRRQHGPARRAMDCRYSNWLMNGVGRVLPNAPLRH